MYCEDSTLSGFMSSETLYFYGPSGQWFSGTGGVLTEKDEYGLGSLCPAQVPNYPYLPAPSGFLRQTQTTYASFPNTSYYTYGPSIFDQPSTILINGSGGTAAAETEYVYDNGPPNTVGNATKITQECLPGSGCTASPTTKYTYDSSGDGQVTSMEDPNLNTTKYYYTDGYDTYLTKILYPPINGVSQYVQFGYNEQTGSLTSAKDQNLQPTSYIYNDPLGRLTEVDYPDGGKTTYGYDSNSCGNPSTETILLQGTTTNYTESYTLDGLCRVTESTVTSDTSNDYTGTVFDGMGRVWTVSNPYRTKTDTSYGLTTNTYDTSGRITSVVYPDGSATTTGYSNNSSQNLTTITDPEGNTRILGTEALGHLLSVNEAGLYTTNYTYNALDDLLTVAQGSQTRTFTYDSLKRLTSATNPESGTTSYTLDGDGNMLTKKDARGITVCYGKWTGSSCDNTSYGYDALNRLVMKSYSDGTPTVNFFYDQAPGSWPAWSGVTFSNAIGRLTVACTGSAQGTCTSPQTAVAYSYDPMGRPSGYWQCTPLNCGNSSIWAASYVYDKAGDLTSWTHPAGFTITQWINRAREIYQVTSSVNDASDPGTLAYGPCTYNSNPAICYTAWGAVSQLENGCAGSGCTNLQETYFYNPRLQMAVAEQGTAGNDAGHYCWVYNYYVGTANASACSEVPSGWPTGTNTTGMWRGTISTDPEKRCQRRNGVRNLFSSAGLSHGTAVYALRTYGGVGGVGGQPLPLSRSFRLEHAVCHTPIVDEPASIRLLSELHAPCPTRLLKGVDCLAELVE